MRVLNALRRAAPTFAREVVHEAAEDRLREGMGLKSVHTGLPTRGGIAYSVVKEAFSFGSTQEKLQLENELQARGISPEGAATLTAGEHPKLPADLANVMHMLDPKGSGGIVIPAASPAGVSVPVGEVYTAALVSDPGKEEE
jgi:hypothetical protein